MKFKLILMPFIFFIVACSKEDGVIEGTVLAEHYNTPLEEVDVEITSVPKFGGKEQFEASGSSDNSGHFKINFQYNSTKQYELHIHSPKILRGGTHSYITSKKTNKDFVLSSASKVKFRVKNTQAHEVQLVISSDEFFERTFGDRMAPNSEGLITSILSARGFGKSAFTYSILSSQNALQIMHDTISILTKTDTLFHVIEIN